VITATLQRLVPVGFQAQQVTPAACASSARYPYHNSGAVKFKIRMSSAKLDFTLATSSPPILPGIRNGCIRATDSDRDAHCLFLDARTVRNFLEKREARNEPWYNVVLTINIKKRIDQFIQVLDEQNRHDSTNLWRLEPTRS
jgi:hypothetical protein